MLNALAVARAKPAAAPYKLTDGNGLFLDVRPTGKKVWRYRYRIDAAENIFTIGEYGERADQFTLVAAREARAVAAALVAQGISPAQHRKYAIVTTVQTHADTFRVAAAKWIAYHSPTKANAKKKCWSESYLSKIIYHFDRDVYPAIGDAPMRSITSAQVLAILRMREATAPQSAILINIWIGGVFRLAIMEGTGVENDPTVALRGAVTRGNVEHYSHLATREIPGFLKDVRACKRSRRIAIGIELLALTFARPGEMRGAKWEEFDLREALWRIPGARMKNRLPHIVPLSVQAVALLRELQAIPKDRESAYLFPHRSRNASVCSQAFNRAIDRLGYGDRVSPHGFRHTASTALNEMGIDDRYIEAQLAHKPPGVRGVYNHAKHLPERVTMMQRWADTIAPRTPKVRALRAA